MEWSELRFVLGQGMLTWVMFFTDGPREFGWPPLLYQFRFLALVAKDEMEKQDMAIYCLT